VVSDPPIAGWGAEREPERNTECGIEPELEAGIDGESGCRIDGDIGEWLDYQ
jgi:hypothetical protein